jgi:hypothetical protein
MKFTHVRETGPAQLAAPAALDIIRRATSDTGRQPCIMRINAAISIVAKFEKVSETAYGKTTRSLCRIPPQV